MSKKKLLITGANGFIGYGAVMYFAQISNYEVIAAVRKIPSNLTFPSHVRVLDHLDIDHDNGWLPAMVEVDYVLHCAARYHIPKNPLTDVLALCRKINVVGSMRVANAALSSGVKRFIFLSSLKVHGEENQLDQPFRETDILRPQYAYGVSKKEAEEKLTALVNGTNMELVIIRPPPVYGPRVPANFLAMLHCIKWGLPIPLASVKSLRSYVALDNLLDFIRITIDHPSASGEIFLVADQRNWSITDLITQLASAMNRRPNLFPVSPIILSWLAKLLGKKALADLLLLPSCVDTSKAQMLLQWTPAIKSEAALRQTAKDYMTRK